MKDNITVSKNSLFKSTNYKVLFISVFVLLSLFLSACGSPLSDKLKEKQKWQTAMDEDDACIRLEFTGNKVKYISVFEGEDTFSQDFAYTVEGSTLIFTNEYATLTFEAELNGDVLSLKSESGENLIFNLLK